MSFLYHKNTKKIIKWVWIVIAILIMASMVASLFAGYM
jgi:hypothetical protein